jgi:ATP-dependent RNA helicase DHX29
LAGQPDPEIMRLSLSYLALRIKILKVDLGSSIEDVLSRALDPPLPVNIQRAVSALVEVCLTTAHLLVEANNLNPVVAGWCTDT